MNDFLRIDQLIIIKMHEYYMTRASRSLFPFLFSLKKFLLTLEWLHTKKMWKVCGCKRMNAQNKIKERARYQKKWTWKRLIRYKYVGSQQQEVRICNCKLRSPLVYLCVSQYVGTYISLCLFLLTQENRRLWDRRQIKSIFMQSTVLSFFLSLFLFFPTNVANVGCNCFKQKKKITAAIRS